MAQPRILVVRGGAIGDFIMTLPAIGALRERWPAAHLAVLGYPHIAELARAPQYADEIRTIEARPLAAFFVPNGALDPAWQNYFGGFNLVVSYLFDPDHIFADNVRRCGPRQVIEASPRPADCPAAVHYCRPLESLAIYVETPTPRVYPTAADSEQAEDFLRGLDRPRRVVLHPGSGSEKKNWAADKFAALGRWLVAELDAQLLVVQGEADARAVAAVLAGLGPVPARVVTGQRLPQLAAVLQQCALFAGNDSGITHLAAAVGTPTVAVFGPASFPIWEPRGDHVRVVRFGPGDTAAAQRAVAELRGATSVER